MTDTTRTGALFAPLPARSEPVTFVCSCERTMVLDEGALKRGCGGDVRFASQLCRGEIDLFRAALGTGEVRVGCTQEAPLFEEVASETGHAGALHFANVRETAGWSDEGAQAGAKMAALIAAAAEPMSPTRFVTLTSGGVALVYGRDETAIEVARRLSDDLDVTVLLSRPGEVTPPRENAFPVARGTIRIAKGHLGAFELSIDDYALPAPSSRRSLVFGPGRNDARSQADIVIDLTGGTPLFPAAELRAGYLRADPNDRAGIERLIREAAGLVGEFDRPAYVQFTPELCAHSRSKKTGCTRCLDLCPTGAIAPAGEHVMIDPAVCAGCGACASVCPTGAAVYALPSAEATMRKLRTLVTTFQQAGGTAPTILVHDGEHGADLIDALGRFGAGLPADVLPMRVNEVTQLDLGFFAAAATYGAAQVRVLTRAKPKHDLSGLERTMGYARTVLAGLGFGSESVDIIGTDDPDLLGAMLRVRADARATPAPGRFLPLGGGRPLLTQAVKELHAAAPAPVGRIDLPERAPFGGLDIKVDGCTLCLSCVSACPTGALSDNTERPMLRFQEDLCVQCGLCAATCPEKVITLAPRLDFESWGAGPKVVKEEEPFHCISCSKPFGVKSTIDKVVAKLENRHWMFSGEQARRISVLKMCEDCRVEVVVNESFDPHAMPQRPAVRTTEDYLRERAARGDDPLN